MDAATATALTTIEGAAAIELAMEQDDPDSLAAATALRRAFRPELAAAALTQAALWRAARPKLGELLDLLPGGLLLSPDGLQQASRVDVSGHHADRFTAAGTLRVFDLGCGIGADAIAFLLAGISVVAVERDPATAILARHNLDLARRVADAEDLTAEVIIADVTEGAVRPGPEDGVFLDPARRNAGRRVWNPDDFSPPWDFAAELLRRPGATGIKLGPGLPHDRIDDSVEAEWLSSGGEAVELGLWSGPGAAPGRWSALIMPETRIVSEPVQLPVSGPLRYVYEPIGAVIRSRAIGTVGAMLDASLLDPQVAYLTSDELIETPTAAAFEVIKELPYSEKVLRAWVRDNGIGTLEIKQRGISLDPALLRLRLKPRGPSSATLLITRTPSGARALHVRRV
ncbi:class I SAM-dependent methyltransferase [Microlunatus parietis]|uniref:SAM-dependent methyltransferase n=1 Tax=Microlunatus parietis TaxID=682979 RepID=A0A7Y9LBU8_9ACTN|nr:class I SAM-dependent methyltransferase [Microlunatus parietis]NYE71025.1 SAM-dependent methyltransferase [Microlunatus parietis]